MREPAGPHDTQAFGLSDPGGFQNSTPPYGYPATDRPARDSAAAAYQYPYGQPRHADQAPPLTQTPPHGESYRHDSGRGADSDRGAEDPRWGSGAWGSGAWDYGRPAAIGARPDPRAERPAYQGGYPAPYEPRGTGRR